MLAGLLDIEIEQGATFNLTFLYEDGVGQPIDLTGMTARMQLRRQYSSSEFILNLTTENGGITIEALTGTITIFISAPDTAVLTGSGVYDLELINGSIVNRILSGSFIICPEVSR